MRGAGRTRREPLGACNTAFKVFHESRVTKHELRPFFACSGRLAVRNAGQSYVVRLRAYPAIHPDDTIVAVSTPPGRGGIGIVRLSGPQALEISEQLVRRAGAAPVPVRRPLLGSLLDDAGNIVDEVLVTLFCAPKSYTAEDVVEISCHGSPAILAFAVERAVRLGARLAEPGEFTRRAFLNGRIDLTQAEAIHDLIEATTIYQARVALQQAKGALSNRLAPVKQQLCDLIALLEAGIDFAEDDIDVASADQLLEHLEAIQSEVQPLVESYRYGKVVRGGLTLAILDAPT